MIMHTKFRFTLNSILCLVLTSCGILGSDAVIEGKVVDNFGNPIAGANVQIENTAFQGTTDNTGQFEIEYAPGTLTLKISLDGYTPHSLDLQINEGLRYPLSKTVLYKKPPRNGVFLVGRDNYIPLLRASIIRRKFGNAGWAGEKYNYRLTLQKDKDKQVDALLATVKEITPKELMEFHVIDSISYKLKPYLIEGDHLGMATIGMMGNSVSEGFNIVKEKSSRFDGFLYRSTTISKEVVPPYSNWSICYVPVGKNLMGRSMINHKKTAYCLPGTKALL